MYNERRFERLVHQDRYYLYAFFSGHTVEEQEKLDSGSMFGYLSWVSRMVERWQEETKRPPRPWTEEITAEFDKWLRREAERARGECALHALDGCHDDEEDRGGLHE